MSHFRDQGVVLRTMRLGEADRIITLVTRSHGKVRAVAKGVRRTSSKFGARLEPFSHVSFLGWQGRGDLDIVSQAEVIDTFRVIREDLDRTSAALSMLEVVDLVSQERHANPPLYVMLVGALGALARQPSPLLAPAFFLKVLALEGSAPVLDACASCGEAAPGSLVAFDLLDGGALCARCRRGRPLSPGALDLLRRVLGGGLAGVLAEPRSPVTDEVASLAIEAIEVHLDRRLRSLRAVPTG
ncbi:MAG: DNA repair protein RecO [Acidimicrobiales bacterium]